MGVEQWCKDEYISERHLPSLCHESGWCCALLTLDKLFASLNFVTIKKVISLSEDITLLSQNQILARKPLENVVWISREFYQVREVMN